jgi:branched-chain amino acid transport system permease protein
MVAAATSRLESLRSRTAVPATSLLLLAGATGLLVGSLRSSIFAQLTVQGLALGSVYGSLALALVLVYRATHVVNFAQGELAMATTYVAWQLIQWGLSYWEAFAVTLAIAFVLGTVLQVVLIRPVQHRSVIAAVIVTVGLFILIDGVVDWVWGSALKFMPSPFGTKTYDVGGVSISRLYPGMFLVVLASVLLVWALFRFTKLGLAMRAGAVNPVAARLLGVRTSWLLALGWGFAAVLGAVSGMMSAPTNFLSPSMMQAVLIFAFAGAILGGLESPVGAVAGGLGLGVLLSMLGTYVHPVTPELRLPVALLILLVVLLIRPAGLFGRVVVRRV